jgi:hypothetical protein
VDLLRLRVLIEKEKDAIAMEVEKMRRDFIGFQ